VQSVSNEFLTAIMATERKILYHVEITLLDNPPDWMGASYSASSTYDATLTPPSQAFDGVNYPQRKFAWVGEDCFPGDDLYPVAPDGSSQVGWWSDNQCDASGNFASSEWVAVDYGSAQHIEVVSVHCYKLWGYPLNPTIEYATAASPGAGDWTALTETPLVDNASEYYYSLVYVLGSAIDARHIRLTFSQWSKASRRAKIIEVEPGWTIDVSDRVKSISITKERSAEDESSTLPIGNSSANEVKIELDNTDGYFYQYNASSPYYGYLVRNRKVRVWFSLGLGATDELPQGLFYSVSWRGSRSSPAVSLTAWDEAKRMQETECDTFPVYESKKISEVVQLLAEHYGLTVGDYSIEATDETIAYSWFDRDNYWRNLNALAEGETGAVYFDESGTLIFENRYHTVSARLASAASSGTNSITVDSVYGFQIGDTIRIDGVDASGTSVYENAVIDAAWDGSTTITLTGNLTNSYVANCYVYLASHAIVATYDDTNFVIDLDDEYVLDKARNKIVVDAKPLRVPLDGMGNPVIGTVWQLSDTDDPLIIDALGSYDITITFESQPVLSNLSYSVEVVLTGEDMVTSATVTNDPGGALDHEWQDGGPFAWGGKLRITTTNPNDVLIVGIEINGVTLEETGKIAGTAEDTSLIPWQGERLYALTSAFIQTRTHAQTLADHLLLRYKEMPPPLNVKGIGMPHLQLADRVKINDSELGYSDANLNNHFYVTRIQLDYDGGLSGEYVLMPA
jgi:hypothetical protein